MTAAPMQSDADGIRSAALAVLDTIVDPCSAASASPMGIVSMGLVRNVSVSQSGAVTIDLRLTSPSCFMVAYLVTESRQRVQALSGVQTVEVDHDDGFDWTPDHIAPDAERVRRRSLTLLPRQEVNP
jgi:metal-sulfur cluster biosynthetic enzyme